MASTRRTQINNRQQHRGKVFVKHNISRFGNFSWKGHLGSNVLAFHLVRIQPDISILDRRYTINPALADKSEGGGAPSKDPRKVGEKQMISKYRAF